MKLVSGIAAVALLCTPGIGQQLDVCPSGCPFTSIQAAINAASNGATIHVKAGTYVERIDLLNKELFLHGDLNADGSPVLDAAGEPVSKIRGFLPNPTNAAVVRIAGGQTGASVIQGFVISRGEVGLTVSQSTPFECQQGAGVRILNSSPTIKNNWLVDNQSYFWGDDDGPFDDGTLFQPGGGAAIYVNCVACVGGGDGGTTPHCPPAPWIIGNRLLLNRADTGGAHGGAIGAWSSTPSIQRNYLHCNTGWNGAAIALVDSMGDVTRNRIEQNEGAQFGGAIDCRRSSPQIVENTIAEHNSSQASDGGGGGIALREDSDAVVEGNWIDGNAAGNLGGGIYVSDSSASILRNQITNNGDIDSQFSELCQTELVPIETDFGGGIAWTDTDAEGDEAETGVIAGNDVQGNRATQGGAGVYLGLEDVTTSNDVLLMTSNIIVANQLLDVAGNGAGIRRDTVALTLTNNTIAHNTIPSGATSSRGGGIFFEGSTAPVVYNSILFANSYSQISKHASSPQATLRYSFAKPYGFDDVVAAGADGTNDYASDPAFAPGAGNYHLTEASPCLHFGSASAPIVPTSDFELEGLVGNPDAGADEFRALSVHTNKISLSAGGVSEFFLDLPTANAADAYVVLGSLTGTSGFPYRGIVVPLTYDAFTDYSLNNPNVYPLSAFQGVLDAAGATNAPTLTLNAASDPALVGPVYFAMGALDLGDPALPVSYVSTAVVIRLLP